LVLEGAQAGLSWSTILKKRENYCKAFDGFDVEKIARYSEGKFQKLLQNGGIVRNRLKIKSTINNAKSFIELQNEFGSFDQYIWKFVDGEPIQNNWKVLSEIPPNTVESGKMSKALKSLGFSFVGSTICYAFMQAVGMVNDHLVDCFRYEEIREGCD
jgi:DNA-3-methyladenine glycosylase I